MEDKAEFEKDMRFLRRDFNAQIEKGKNIQKVRRKQKIQKRANDNSQRV